MILYCVCEYVACHNNNQDKYSAPTNGVLFVGIQETREQLSKSNKFDFNLHMSETKAMTDCDDVHFISYTSCSSAAVYVDRKFDEQEVYGARRKRSFV